MRTSSRDHEPDGGSASARPIRLVVLAAWIATAALAMTAIDFVQLWSMSGGDGAISFALVHAASSWAPWVMLALPLAWVNARFPAIPGVTARFVSVHLLAAGLVFGLVWAWATLTEPFVHEVHSDYFRSQIRAQMVEFRESTTLPELFPERGAQPLHAASFEEALERMFEGGSPEFADGAMVMMPDEFEDLFPEDAETIGLVDVQGPGWFPWMLQVLIVYGALSALSQFAIVGREFARARTAEAELRSRHDRMRLDTLRSRVDPHFLYNALTNISAATREDPETARAMIVDLADLMRDSSAQHSSLVTTLEDELALLRRYLSLVARRYGERIHVQFRVAPETLGRSLPGWSLQPLLENVVTHGVEHTTETVHVWIHAVLRDELLEITVRDDAPRASETHSASNGTALANLRERLTKLFGPRSSLTGEPGPERGYVAQLRVPRNRIEDRES